ncbi:hypothetical protein BCR35DRAFT_17906 [Leucosporidium creatinivorum]|uniref:Uncharacterized protein n=1 Tax=Leucosporidium creatinivorum TaxID=106004 RepID=A0A1Y2D281_9BASI|nr:hypothetical protein BCR35DRAFT_17906 [Leucosporidium creatinivorum]
MGGGGEEAFGKFEGEHEEEDEGERIPWESKGKGRALDEEGEVDFGAEGPVDEQEEGGWQEDEDEQMDEQYGSDQEDDEAGKVAASLTSQRLPPAPSLAKVAANRKKRLAVGGEAGTRTTKKKRTQRFTPTGHPVSDLPLHRQKALLQHFLGPNVKVDEKGMEEVMDACVSLLLSSLSFSSISFFRQGRTTS